MSGTGQQLWIDASAGVAGDMLLGALIDAGADLEVIRAAVDCVIPGSVRLDAAVVTRAGQRATKVEVVVLVDDPPHRSWETIRTLLSAGDLASSTEQRALAVFGRLAEAEGYVHGIPAADVHFHEVGALDSLADVVGVCAALSDLGIDSISAGEVALGGGRVPTAHGDLPVPVPAVARLATGWRVLAGGRGELATPTGMALIAALSERCEDLPAMQVSRVGVGAGTKDTAGRPNVTRVIIGSPDAAVDGAGEPNLLLESNVDDLDPRLWPGVLQHLIAAGAADAWLVPILMKKGRPAHTLNVLCRPDQSAPLRQIIFADTSTIGVREHQVRKYALARGWREVEVDGGQVSVKIAHREGTIVQVTPEFDTITELALRLQVPPRLLLEQAIAATQAAPVWSREPGRALIDRDRSPGPRATRHRSVVMPIDPGPDADRLGALALLAARAGVAAIRLATERGISAEFKTGAHDLVTAADRGSETAVIDIIVESRPDDEILGEEGGSREGTSGVRWLIDPLDGTANFVYGRADHAVSVGVQRSGRRAAGAIIRPADGRWAMAAGGAVTFGRDARDGRPIDEPVPPPIDRVTPLTRALVCFGLPTPQTQRASRPCP